VQRSWLIRAGGWLWAVTGRGPSVARRVVRSQERLQKPSGEANVRLLTFFPRTLTQLDNKKLSGPLEASYKMPPDY